MSEIRVPVGAGSMLVFDSDDVEQVEIQRGTVVTGGSDEEHVYREYDGHCRVVLHFTAGTRARSEAIE